MYVAAPRHVLLEFKVLCRKVELKRNLNDATKFILMEIILIVQHGSGTHMQSRILLHYLARKNESSRGLDSLQAKPAMQKIEGCAASFPPLSACVPALLRLRLLFPSSSKKPHVCSSETAQQWRAVKLLCALFFELCALSRKTKRLTRPCPTLRCLVTLSQP